MSIRHPSGKGEPVLTDSTIAINGDENGEDAHESFILDRNTKKNGNCCETARKPYDEVVTAVLIRATQLLGSNYMEGSDKDEINTDGDWDEWIGGRELVKQVFPNDEVTCPWNS